MYNDPNITAEVICDSINRHDRRLTTMIWTYPRIILAEVNTHRMLSRSTASSRAIPIAKQIAKVRNKATRFYPSWLGAAQSGMQANAELNPSQSEDFYETWDEAADNAIFYAESLDEIGVHKQIANRLLEPFTYVTSIVSATDWPNLFKLRAHPDAQPEFMVLAFKALEALVESVPIETDVHIPFGDQMEPGLFEDERMMVACARCARISYETHDGKRDAKEDIRLAKQLIAAGHMSPFEHVARSFATDVRIGNFRGWVQYRKTLDKENVESIDYKALLKTKPAWIL